MHSIQWREKEVANHIIDVTPKERDGRKVGREFCLKEECTVQFSFLLFTFVKRHTEPDVSQGVFPIVGLQADIM